MDTGQHRRDFERSRRRLSRWLGCCAVLILALCPRLSYAQKDLHILLLMSGSGGPYAVYQQALADSLAGRPQAVDLTSMEIGDSDALMPAELERIDEAGLVIAVGTRATAAVAAARSRTPVLSVLVPRVTFSALTDKTHGMGAIFLDQPPARYLALARLLLPDLHSAGVVYGPYSKAQKADVARAAQTMHIALRTATIGDAGIDSPLDALQSVLEDSRVLIALPDPSIYNRYTIQGILLTTFRHRVPVIGYSASMLRAGATAAAFSDAEQIARQTAEDLHSILAAPDRYQHYPRYYHVRFNRAVARSLELTPPDRSSARSLMQTMEKSDARTPGNP